MKTRYSQCVQCENTVTDYIPEKYFQIQLTRTRTHLMTHLNSIVIRTKMALNLKIFLMRLAWSA
jgi:hypothetical protein